MVSPMHFYILIKRYWQFLECHLISLSFLLHGQDPTSEGAVPPTRAGLLKSMMDTSSNALVAMASELLEAEDRESVCTGPSRW